MQTSSSGRLTGQQPEEGVVGYMVSERKYDIDDHEVLMKFSSAAQLTLCPPSVVVFVVTLGGDPQASCPPR